MGNCASLAGRPLSLTPFLPRLCLFRGLSQAVISVEVEFPFQASLPPLRIIPKFLSLP